MMKEIHIDDADEYIQLDLWDTAGQEVFADLTKSYYRNAGACVLAFSTTDRYNNTYIPQTADFFSHTHTHTHTGSPSKISRAGNRRWSVSSTLLRPCAWCRQRYTTPQCSLTHTHTHRST